MKDLQILLFLLCTTWVFAQQTSGTVTFIETVELKIDLPKDQAYLKDMIPTNQTFTKELIFDSNRSIYKDLQKVQEEENITPDPESGNMQIKMVFTNADNRLYKDLEQGTQKNSVDFRGKRFLIEGPLKSHKWKITGEQKQILDYPCQKATFQDSARTVEAWFTTQIPVPSGPSVYGQLPGLILEVIIDDGERKLSAQSIAFDQPTEEDFQLPKKGKKVTAEEFKEIQEAKLKEMQEEFGGSGNVIIKTRRSNG